MCSVHNAQWDNIRGRARMTGGCTSVNGLTGLWTQAAESRAEDWTDGPRVAPSRALGCVNPLKRLNGDVLFADFAIRQVAKRDKKKGGQKGSASRKGQALI